MIIEDKLGQTIEHIAAQQYKTVDQLVGAALIAMKTIKMHRQQKLS